MNFSTFHRLPQFLQNTNKVIGSSALRVWASVYAQLFCLQLKSFHISFSQFINESFFYRRHWMRSVPVPSSVASWYSLIARPVNFVRSCFNASLAISYVRKKKKGHWLCPNELQTSAVRIASRSGVIKPRRTLIRRLGFLASFKFATRLRIRLRYFTLVSFNSL